MKAQKTSKKKVETRGRKHIFPKGVKRVPCSLSIPQNLKKEFLTLTKKEGRSFSAQIRLAMEEMLERRKA